MTPARTAAALSALLLLASGCGLVQHSAALTFQVGNVECAPSKSANALGQVCSFLAFYGNISKHSIQVEPSTTMVLDKAGKTFLPTPDATGAGTFLLKPGQQQQVSWSVALPTNTRPTKVQWHGSAVDVQFQVPGAIGPSDSAAPSSAALAAPSSAAPSSAAPSTAAPSTSVAPTTPPPPSAVAPTTTTATPTKSTRPPVKPTKSSPKPTKTTPAPTTTPTHTPPPTSPTPTHVRHTIPPVRHTVAPTTTPAGNSTNPGGGIGHIG